MDETLEEAARRELEEETGLKNVSLRQLKAYSAIHRDPRHRTVSVAFWGMYAGRQEPRAGDDAREAAWFAVDNLPALAFDHDRIVADGLLEIRKLKQ